MSNRTDPNPSPAELFERFLDHARPRPGERVLDVACATGIVARHTAPGVGADGAVVGVDINPEMLAVARERSASENIPVDWREADAMELPFADESFDLALCQQGLQFFADPRVAMKEPETFIALTVRAGAAVVPELAPEDPTERAELVEVIARETAEVLRAHRVGDRLRFPMPNYIALAQA